MQKRKETSFTFRSHVWDRGKSVGITVRFLLGAWIIILFVVSSWQRAECFFFSLKVVSKPKAATYAFDFRFITNGSCFNPTPIPAAQTPTSKLNKTCVLQESRLCLLLCYVIPTVVLFLVVFNLSRSLSFTLNI